MKRIYVDTGGFMGFLIAEDACHSAARALFQQASAERWQLVTTNIAGIETYSVLLVRTRDRCRSTMMFFDMMLNDAYHIERIRPDDEENAFDRHFREYGKFRIL